MQNFQMKEKKHKLEGERNHFLSKEVLAHKFCSGESRIFE